MIINKIIEIIIYGRFDSYLKKVKGVIHIGASDGYERKIYKRYNVSNVIYIEADPSIFQKLKKNLKSYKGYEAYNYLLTDRANKRYKFNITKDNGQSSSILKMQKTFMQMYPSAKIYKKIYMRSDTLKTFTQKNSINLNQFDSLVIDTQGSELLVLKGCKNLLNKFNTVKIEAAEFELYKNYPLLNEITDYMNKYNFKELRRTETDSDIFGRKTFDILFVKNTI